MKVQYTEDGKVNLIGLTRDEYHALHLIAHVSKRCFPLRDEEDHLWYSHDCGRFACALTDEQKAALDKMDFK